MTYLLKMSSLTKYKAYENNKADNRIEKGAKKVLNNDKLILLKFCIEGMSFYRKYIAEIRKIQVKDVFIDPPLV